MLTRKRVVALVVAVVLVTAVVAGLVRHRADQGPVLVANGMANISEGAARVHRGDVITIGSMFGCLDKPGSVTVKDVTAVHPQGLQVVGFAVRPNPGWKPSPTTGRGEVGLERRPLSRLAFSPSHVVTTQCGTQGQGVEFALEVRKTTSGEAGLRSVRVTYTTGGDTKTIVFPLAVRLCNEDKAWSHQCRSLKV